MGPYYVTGTKEENKIVCFQDAKIGNSRPFYIAQVEPLNVAHLFFANLCQALSHFSSPSKSNESLAQLTEVIDPLNSRASSKEMTEDKKV